MDDITLLIELEAIGSLILPRANAKATKESEMDPSALTVY
jgi:hypothetical protein